MNTINDRVDAKLKEVVKRKGIPFDITLEKSGLELALEDIIEGRVRTFDSVDDLLEDLNDDED